MAATAENLNPGSSGPFTEPRRQMTVFCIPLPVVTVVLDTLFFVLAYGQIPRNYIPYCNQHHGSQQAARACETPTKTAAFAPVLYHGYIYVQLPYG